MDERIENITTKNIKEFTPTDTIYINKMIGCYSHIILCQFVKFERGIVTGIVIKTDRQYCTINKGESIKARLKKCCLFGKPKGASYSYCNWFNSKGTI
jgi:hypothetical protein